ncbi:hypothetical protein JR316_0002133 [Psilocybe cubensis]|uniref:Uncharacterized protein n=2 Tax=Psilocybe cubensis TaxID=181762 RepID=A0ACB8HBB7_PSICU|nr:hypothetical protein JR316_0002133 [Psilocybe cubensis]KAH9485226.1 hypothetical protein JR316_0002133 [Psilocybe cubensis]
MSTARNQDVPLKEPSLLPFPQGKLTVEHRKQLIVIRACLISWLIARSDVDDNVPNASNNLEKATEELSKLQVQAPFAFTPSPTYIFRSVLLSCIKCYWIALVESLDTPEKDELAARLSLVPPYGQRIPKLNGKKCVDAPADLNEKEYEGLMRVLTLVIVDLTSDDVMKMWRELAEVGVQTWEESD